MKGASVTKGSTGARVLSFEKRTSKCARSPRFFEISEGELEVHKHSLPTTLEVCHNDMREMTSLKGPRRGGLVWVQRCQRGERVAQLTRCERRTQGPPGDVPKAHRPRRLRSERRRRRITAYAES